MDVHHHTQTSRSRWTHYLWEFLMLFLAVFFGFLAENQREHYVEHKREKEFARSLSDDLNSNVSLLNSAIEEISFVIPKIDTFILLVHKNSIGEIPSGTWYYYGRFGTRNPVFSLKEATLKQLLSSGGLRYFKKRHVVHAIAEYEQFLGGMKNLGSLDLLLDTEIVKARNKLFDTFFLNEIMSLSVPHELVDSFKRKSLPLLTMDKSDFIQYANLCQMRCYDQKLIKSKMEEAMAITNNLLSLLKKEYRLK